MYPHRIRLRGPWECTPLTGTAAGSRRVTMPCHWGQAGLPGFGGRVRFVRRFGYPGRLDEGERVWLTFAGVEGEAIGSLNGTTLGRCFTGCETEVKALLRERNELVVDVEASSDRGGLWGEVALEIRRTAWLAEVEVRPRPDGVEITGRVKGHWEQPLEIYAVLGRRPLAYGVVEPARGEQGFSLQGQVESWPDPAVCRVDLIEGATIWYTVERPVATEPA